jgi:hypothetical protein
MTRRASGLVGADIALSSVMTSEAPRGEGRRGANERLWLGGWGSAPVGHVNKRGADLFRRYRRPSSSPIRLAQSRIGEGLWRVSRSVVRRKERASLDVATAAGSSPSDIPCLPRHICELRICLPTLT